MTRDNHQTATSKPLYLGAITRGERKAVLFTIPGRKLPPEGAARFRFTFTAFYTDESGAEHLVWRKRGAPSVPGPFTLVSPGAPRRLTTSRGVPTIPAAAALITCAIEADDTDALPPHLPLPDEPLTLSWTFQALDHTGRSVVAQSGALTVIPPPTVEAE